MDKLFSLLYFLICSSVLRAKHCTLQGYRAGEYNYENCWTESEPTFSFLGHPDNRDTDQQAKAWCQFSKAARRFHFDKPEEKKAERVSKRKVIILK